MFLRTITIKGITRLYFYESYYDNGKTRQKWVESSGRLDKLAEEFPDPISHFKQVAQERSDEAKTDSTASIPIDLTSVMDQNEDNQKNVGYSVLKELYKQLELDKFWKSIQKKTSIHYDLEAVFRLLVFSRILYPGSKMDTFNKKEIYFEKMDGFALEDVYRALDIFDQHNEELQKWIYEHSSAICERDMSVSYFDCTNYYFDIGRSDMDTFGENGSPVDRVGTRQK